MLRVGERTTTIANGSAECPYRRIGATSAGDLRMFAVREVGKNNGGVWLVLAKGGGGESRDKKQLAGEKFIAGV